MADNNFYAKLTCSYQTFKLSYSGDPNNYKLSSDGFTLTLIGTSIQINNMLKDVNFVSTDLGISTAKTFEANEDIDIIEVINIEITAIRNNKKYTKTGSITFVLDSFKHSEFVISGTNKAFMLSVNDVVWSDFTTSGYNKIYVNQIIADAEKHPPITNTDNYSDYRTMDDKLCWAASSSDMIEFSGWWRGLLGLLPNQIDREDKIFRYFIDNSKYDRGYWQFYGILWFSCGYIYKVSGAWEPRSGGNLLGYCLDNPPYNKLFWLENWDHSLPNLNFMQFIDRYIKNGCYVGIGIYNWNTTHTAYDLGHAVTVIGFSYNTKYTPNNKNYYTGLFIVDSDNQHSQPISSHRDIVTYCPIIWSSNIAYLDIYRGSYTNVFMLSACVLGRNNNDNRWFFDYGTLTDTTDNYQWRDISTTSATIKTTTFIGTDILEYPLTKKELERNGK